MLDRYTASSKKFLTHPEFTKGTWKSNMLGLLRDTSVTMSDFAYFLGTPNHAANKRVAAFLAGVFANEIVGNSLDPDVNDYLTKVWDNAVYPTSIVLPHLKQMDTSLARARRKRPPRSELAAIDYAQASCNFLAILDQLPQGDDYQETVRSVFNAYLEAATYERMAETRAAQKHQANIIGLTYEETHKLFSDDLRTTLTAIFENLK